MAEGRHGGHDPLEQELEQQYVTTLAQLVETHLDLDLLLRMALPVASPSQAVLPYAVATGPRPRLAFAEDAAFCCYYR
jgi:cobyrinic acid a,c-diamide synthase